PPAALRPILECVVENGPASFTAHFGYRNDGEARIEIPPGPRNAVSPAPGERGQPTAFAPGRTPRFPASVFEVDFDGREIGGPPGGPEGGARPATASAWSRRCAAAADASAPRLSVREPRDGAFLATRQPRLELGYEDDGALDLASLRVTIDGIDRTGWFAAGPRQGGAGGKTQRTLARGRVRVRGPRQSAPRRG